MSKPVMAVLEPEMKGIISEARDIFQNTYNPSQFVQDLENMSFIMHCLKRNIVTFKKRAPLSDSSRNANIAETAVLNNKKEVKKQPGRKTRTHSARENSPAKSESSEHSLNDSQGSTTSTASSRSRRAAAQAAGQKIAQVHSFMNQKKLRRPTDYDGKKVNNLDASLPPPKVQKTTLNQSAVRSLNDEKENQPIVDPVKKDAEQDKLDGRQKSRSLSKGRVSNKRKSEDLFDESEEDSPLAKSGNNHGLAKGGKKKKGGDITQNEVKKEKNDNKKEETVRLTGPVAQSSPICDSLDDGFKGFASEPESSGGKNRTEAGTTFVHSSPISSDVNTNKKRDRSHLRRSKSLILLDESGRNKNEKAAEVCELDDSDIEIVETKNHNKTMKPENKMTKKQLNETKNVDKGNTNKNENTFIIEEKSDSTQSSRPKVIKKVGKTNNSVEEVRVDSSDDESLATTKTRTRTIRKKVDSQSSEDKSPVVERSRTRTLKKGKETDDLPEMASKYLATEFKSATVKITKIPAANSPHSQAAVKGELVKKRVEDFEKKHGKKSPEETGASGSGRITRNASKSRLPETKIPKTLNSATHNSAVIQKQMAEELEKKLKEEKRLQMQAREEEAQKKREQALRAQAEEAKRKREEKYQKVVAAKEAAKREKAEMAEKVEKSKEDKMKVMTAEKEKRKEEMLKKKLLAQQKALEHEERRKQEEAARLAKLREQEEEHKRVMAMKEREMEAKKAMKPIKVAPNIVKIKTEQPTTPGAHAEASYEITPSRDERPLLKPKTENDYGIDDAHSSDESEDESCPKKQIPLWAQSKNRQRLVATSAFVPTALWDQFMECNPCMPDVTKIFTGMPVKKRIRTSSAVWNTPPLAAAARTLKI